jgi:hypothetical protein
MTTPAASDNDVVNITEEEDEEDDGDKETFVVLDFIGLVRDIQNRSSKQVGTQEVEKRRFKEFFDTSLEVLEILWEMRDAL